ncbi:MAG: DUF1329 domain-containing protein [Pseudomonadota bacterium]
MKYFKVAVICITTCLLFGGMLPAGLLAEEWPDPKSYIPTLEEMDKLKNFYDDPRPFMTGLYKKILPPELYKKLSHDPEEMKKAWADAVGFKAPDVVGKIHPEIKPGKYTWKDVQNNPAFKELMWQTMFDRIKPPGPPFAGNIPEFEIIPTRQYYWSLPVSKATKENEGKTKLDDNGYIIADTLEVGYPFPKPSGKFKAQQIIYNWESRYQNNSFNFYLLGRAYAYDKNLKTDFDGAFWVKGISLSGREVEPIGFYDERAQKQGERRCIAFQFTAPRDVAGMTQFATFYIDPKKLDSLLMYLPSMRRLRKMSASDSQDPVGGTDAIYDDNEGFLQKLSPDIYPYKYEVIAEREYLMPAPSIDGAEYIMSPEKGLGVGNVRMERRPIFVVQLTQLDKNYVYSKRVIYFDAERFQLYNSENYDQKGRLYRSWFNPSSFVPELGAGFQGGAVQCWRDYIDLHTTMRQDVCHLPAYWTRGDLSPQTLLNQK